MPTAPGINEFNQNPAPQSVPYQGQAPEGAFGGQIGGALEQAGSEIGRIAAEERQKTYAANAIAAGTTYELYLSKTVYDAENGFASLKGKDAVVGHEKAKQDAADVREKVANSLGSRTEQREFLNSSARPFRLALDDIDRHTSTQSKVYRAGTLHSSITQATTQAAQMVASNQFGPSKDDKFAGLRAVVDRAGEVADIFSAGEKLDENTAAGVRETAQATVADSILSTANKMDGGATGEQAVALAEEFKGFLGERGLQHLLTAQNKKTAQATNAQAEQLLLKAGHVNYLGEALPVNKRYPDLDGPLNMDRLNHLYAKSPDPDGSLAKQLNKLVAAAKTENDRTVEEKLERISANGGTGAKGGAAAPEIQWMESHASRKLAAEKKIEVGTEMRALRDETYHEKLSSDAWYQEASTKLNAMSPEQRKGLSVSDFVHDGDNVRSADRDRLKKALNDLNNPKPGAPGNLKIEPIVKGELQEFKGSAGYATMNTKITALTREFQEANPKSTADDLRKYVQSQTKETVKSSFFGAGRRQWQDTVDAHDAARAQVEAGLRAAKPPTVSSPPTSAPAPAAPKPQSEKGGTVPLTQQEVKDQADMLQFVRAPRPTDPHDAGYWDKVRARFKEMGIKVEQ